MKKHKEFAPADRYIYDFDLCSSEKGLAQIDTRSDASDFGNWVNPFTLVIFSYIKGDCYTIECASVEEFTVEMRLIKEFYGKDFIGIDAGFDEALKQGFIDIGLGEMLH